VFGFSFGELLVICVVALIAVGPKKLPGMLQTLGQWLRKIRNLTVEVRNQTGIDDLLRSEGLNGGLNELRGLLRGNHHSMPFEAPAPLPTPRAPIEDPYANLEIDVSREYPQEGADAHGALPDDLLQDDPPKQDSAAAPAVVVAEPVPDAAAGPTESA
jgi:sec-independent protein translocase protein TatB